MIKRLFYVCSLLLVVGAMMSCSGDDDKIDDGSGNTSDVAVTGLSSEIGTTYVCLNGYVNLDLLPPGSSSPSIGIELYIQREQVENELDEDYYWGYETTQDIVGRKFAILFDDLNGKEAYKYRTFVKSGSLSYYGEYRTFTTKDFVNITSTGDVSDITFTSASITATANVESVNSKEDIGIGIAYSTSKSMLHPDSLFNRKEGYLRKSYSVTLSRLLAGTEYYYCSYTRAGNTYKLGTVKSFKTKSLDNQLQTSEATDVTFISAVLNGTSTLASLYPESSSISYGFRYALTKEALEGVNIPEGYYYYDSYYDYDIYYNPQTGNMIYIGQSDGKTVSASIADNTFKAKVTNLSADKTYYYCAYVTVDGVELTGEVKSFTTKSIDGYLSIEEAEDITATSAKVRGKSTLESLYENSSSPINYSFLYGASKSYLEDDYSCDYEIPTWNGDNLIALLSNLSEERTYYYRLRAYVEGVYLYSDIKEFKTKSASDYLSTGDATDITLTTADVTGTTSLSEIYPNAPSISYYVYYATSEIDLTSSYSSYRESVIASKDGDNLKASLLGLSPNEKYYYRMVAYIDSRYVYGDIKKFTTKSGKDYLKTGGATNITLTTADIAGTTTFSEIYPSGSSISYYVYYATSEIDLTSSYSSYHESVIASKDGDNLKASLSGLSPNENYYYRVVAYVDGRYVYGDIKEFKTKSAYDYLSTGDATNITLATADIAGTTTLSVVYPSSSSISYYIYYATSEEYLTSTNRKSIAASKDGDGLKATLSGLIVATTYYYCVAASVNGRIVLGDIKSFTTKDLQTTGYVDLGLSCKWAACNLGSSAPESTGDYYAWGDVKSRASFSSLDYSHYNQDIGTDISGTDYDAARKVLGSPWRMPTQAEFQELLDKCRLSQVVYKNTIGYLVTGKNGNAIFLPKAGFKVDNDSYSNYGYWTSTKYSSSNDNAYIYAGTKLSNTYRYYGLIIRPVQD